jgi:predicted MPP superfamily phosphohydrolase
MRVVQAINALEKDLVVITGDIITASEPLAKLFST